MSRKNKFTIEYVRDYIEKEGCFLISEEYKNCDNPLRISYPCGHEGRNTFYNFKVGHRCDICAHEKLNELKRRKEKDIISYLKSNNLKFICFPKGYRNGNSLVICVCLSCNTKITKAVKLFYREFVCSNCSWKKMSENRLGDRGSNWQGGITSLRAFLSKRIQDWKLESAKKYDYRCFLTGKPFEEVHHLMPFTKILEEALSKSKMDGKPVSEYNQKELESIAKIFTELHKKYGFGIPLTKKVHRKFHQLFGKENNTPDQFYEFCDHIKVGEI